jgi:RNA polymerase sigma factor (sigma-70 family)
MITIEERNRMVMDSDWVINKLLKEYSHLPNVSIDDMRQEAYEFMIRGAETYDPSKGTKPSTHLYRWARAGILDWLAENRNVHIPRNKINDQIRLNRKETDVKRSRIINKEVSLDKSFDDNHGSGSDMQSDKVHKQVFDSITADPENIYGDTELQEHINHCVEGIGILSPIEQFTIIHRFGLNGQIVKTQAEISSLTATPPVMEKLGRKYSTMGINKAERRAKAKLKENETFKEVLI